MRIRPGRVSAEDLGVAFDLFEQGLVDLPALVVPQIAPSVSEFGRDAVGQLVPRKQLTGLPPKKVIWPMSPLVGLPKKPFSENLFSKTWLPQSS